MSPRLHLLTLGCATVLAPAAWAAKCDRVSRPLQVTATTMNFGTYNAASPTADTANATITVACVNPADDLDVFSIALSRGSSATYSPRTMTSGANTLSYNIFTSASFVTIWGDGTGGTVTVAPGSYTDTITVTVTY
jgi:spore coat protein U-like protein